MKILVVDDELVSRKKMEKIFQSFGVVQGVDNGEKAVIVFRTALDSANRFDLITLDIEMPGMDGTETLTEIRELEQKEDIPEDKRVKVLMVTSHSNKIYVMASVKAGCNDYIVKPFTKEIVIRKLFDLDIPIPV